MDFSFLWSFFRLPRDTADSRMTAEGIISSTVHSDPWCGGTAVVRGYLWPGGILCLCSSEEFHQGKRGSSFLSHPHVSLKSSLFLSAHADCEVPLQVRPLSWAAGVQIFEKSSLFSPAACLHEDQSQGALRSSVFCTFRSLFPLLTTATLLYSLNTKELL